MLKIISLLGGWGFFLCLLAFYIIAVICIQKFWINLQKVPFNKPRTLLKLFAYMIPLPPLFIYFVWFALIGVPNCMGRIETQQLIKVAMRRSNDFMSKYHRYPSSFKEINIESSKPVLSRYGSRLDTHYTLYLINGRLIDQVASSEKGRFGFAYPLPEQFKKCLSGDFCIYAVMDVKPEHKELDVLYIDSGMKVEAAISGYKYCKEINVRSEH
jgi:hypothetical protein